MIEALSIAVLAVVAFEDFRTRWIHWWLFPLLATSLLMGSVVESGWHVAMRSVVSNLCYLVMIGLVMLGYLYFRNGSISIKGRIGWGDVLFALSMCFGLSFSNYVIWLVLAALIGTMIGVFYLWRGSKEIPWAGIMALLTIGLITAKLLTGISLVNDNLVSLVL